MSKLKVFKGVAQSAVAAIGFCQNLLRSKKSRFHD